MTIGIPRIPLILKEEDRILWLDVEERLAYERLLFISGILDNNEGNRIIRLLLILEDQDEYGDIFLHINSPGGGAYLAIAIYDVMNTIRPDVCTLAMGLAASAASLILCAGAAKRRIGLCRSRILIHQPAITCRFFATPDIMASEAKEMFNLRNTIANIYARNTGQPLSVIQPDLERDTFMSAEEAQAYGIIDRVAKPRTDE